MSSLLMLILLGAYGLLQWSTMILAVANIPLVFVGIGLGTRMRRFLLERQFRRLVLLLLAAGGLALILRCYL